MKLQRIAAVALTAAIAPVVLLSSPALADTVPAPAATTQPSTGDKPADTKKLSVVPISFSGDTKLNAGQWLNLRLTVTNPDPAALSGFRLGLVTGMNMPSPRKGEIQFEEHAQDGSWKPLPAEPNDINEFELALPTIGKGGSVTVELRLRYAERLFRADSKNGFIYPYVANRTPDRELDRYPFFRFVPTPVVPTTQPTAKPETGKPTAQPTGRPETAKPLPTSPVTKKPEVITQSPGTPDGKPGTGGDKSPNGDSTGTPAATGGGNGGSAGGDLASTGAGTALPWALGGGAAAVALGAGLFLKSRNRQARQH
jgi:hypothetical protein